MISRCRSRTTLNDDSGRQLIARVRHLCRRKGRDLGDLARQAGVSRSTLCHLAQGRTREPHGSTLRKNSRALEISPEKLWDEPTQIPLPDGSLDFGLRENVETNDFQRRRAFDRNTNTVVDEVSRELPDLFRGWMYEVWNELYIVFGTGGQLSRVGVVESAKKINSWRLKLSLPT